jgi:hypothetical protein
VVPADETEALGAASATIFLIAKIVPTRSGEYVSNIFVYLW